jgi:hypothetical protein
MTISNDRSERAASLDWDIPTTPADIEVLRRHGAGKSDTQAYLRFLAGFPAASPQVLRMKKGPCGEPFRL